MSHRRPLFLGLPALLLAASLSLQACESNAAGETRSVPRRKGDPWVVHEGRLYDINDRQVLLRGVNARVGGIFDVELADGVQLQYIPPFGADDCRFLARELGLNHLRLPIQWSAIEPERGHYDDAYLDRVAAIVEVCANEGVWTIVDFHQDAWSKWIGEDGAPLWAIVPPPDEILGPPLDNLAARRVSEQTLRAFVSFWNDAEGIRSAFTAMAAHTAARFDGVPGLVGIEMFNEPVLPDGSPDGALDAFYAEVAAAMRAVAPRLTIAFEPDAIRNFTNRAPVNTPFLFGDALYAPHVYVNVFIDGWANRDENALRRSLEAAADEAGRHGAGLWIGEFGNTPTSETGRLYVERAMDVMDELAAHWALWLYEEASQGSWGLWDAAGTATAPARGPLREEIADVISRPYPQAVDGMIAGIRWELSSRTLTVELQRAGPGAHEIGASPRHWPTPPRATCDGRPANIRALPGRVAVVCEGRRLVLAP